MHSRACATKLKSGRPKEQRSRSFDPRTQAVLQHLDRDAVLGLRMALVGDGFLQEAWSNTPDPAEMGVPDTQNFISRRRGLLCPSKPKTGLPGAPACGPQFLVEWHVAVDWVFTGRELAAWAQAGTHRRRRAPAIHHFLVEGTSGVPSEEAGELLKSVFEPCDPDFGQPCSKV
jgi:hypothetical protein